MCTQYTIKFLFVATAMRILNLTPHSISYDDGQRCKKISSSGVVRLDQATKPSKPIDGFEVVTSEYGGVSGVPEDLCSGDVLIVSSVVANHWPEADRPKGITLLVPDTGNSCKRDKNGKVTSVSRFILK